jgi:lipopolysaccharide transport system ATP-binding protein
VLVEAQQELPSLVLGYIIKDRLGMPIFGSNTHHLNQVQHTLKPGEKLEYRFQFKANLGAGTYSIALAAHADDNHLSNNYLWNDRIIQFTVVNTKEHFEGVNWMPPTLSIKR